MSELKVLEWALFIYSLGFLAKLTVFAVLAWFMRPFPGESDFSKSMRHHYTSLALQAAPLSLLYMYYFISIESPERVAWVTAPMRIVVYVLGAALVIIASWFGVRLLVAYWNTVDGSEVRSRMKQNMSRKRDLS